MSALLGMAFTLFMIVFIIAAITAAACRNDRYSGETKLRFCNISRVAGTPFDLFGIERAKRSIIHLERGIALSQIGNADGARDAFRKALIDARSKGGSWEDELHRRMRSLKDKQARDLWVQALMAAAS